MNRDVLIGVVAGMAALIVMGWRRTEVSSPDGVYQATIDQKKYREMEQTLAPPSLSTLETRRRLQTRIEKLEVQNARFDWIIGYLADASGVDIAVEWAGVRPYAPPDQPVSLNLYNVPVIQALQEALAQAAGAGQMNVALRIEPGRVLISLADRLNKREQVMRVYDVRDLLHMALDPSWALKPWKGPPAPLPQQRSEEPRRDATDWLDRVVTEQDACEALVRYIKSNVDPPSWRENGGEGGIGLMAGKLIVVQSRENQDQTAVFLDWMRQVLR